MNDLDALPPPDAHRPTSLGRRVREAFRAVARQRSSRVATGIPLVLVMALVCTPFTAAAETGSTTCLIGTDASVAGDAAQIAALRELIDASCPCASFDGSTGRTRGAYVRCATDVINAQANTPPGNLRPACKATVRRYYSQSTCGLRPVVHALPCISTSRKTGAVRCSIKPTTTLDGITAAARCRDAAGTSRVSCPGFTTCIDAADLDRDLRIAAPGDTGACAALPAATPSPDLIATATSTAVPAPSATGTPSASPPHTPTHTPTDTPSPTRSATAAPTATGTPPPTATVTPTRTATHTPSATTTATSTATVTPSHTPTASPTRTASRTPSATPTATTPPNPTPTSTLAVTATPSGQLNSLSRPSDPVVMRGAALTALLGSSVEDIVAFRYSAQSQSWSQVPVQVDERGSYTVRDCYNGAYGALGIVEYTDANTWVGGDATTAFDADDELVFMAFDTGDKAPGAARPAGVAGSPAAQVTVGDPADGGSGWLYLFLRASMALEPSAGRRYVDYQFKFGPSFQYGPTDYKARYDLNGGVLENSTVTGLDGGGSPVYRTHFSMKWIRDDLHLFKGGASGIDILDADQAEWAGGTCSRNIATFSNGESCFSINKSGPVRALRQYFGANSGWAMQRTHEFYQSMEVVRVNFRLHDGVANQAYMDHNTNAYGMRYYNNNTLGGVTADGVADSVTPLTQWAMLSGSPAGNQGSYSTHLAWHTNLPDLVAQGVYDDNGTNSTTFSNCYGTPAAISIIGAQFFSNYCTDPYAGQPSCSGGWYFIPSLTLYFEGTGMTVPQAQQRDAWVRNPLAASAAAF